MRNAMRAVLLSVACGVLLVASVPAARGADGNHGWSESSAGRWLSLPERHVGAWDNGISLELALPPGSGVAYERDGRWQPSGVSLALAVDNVNLSGNEYRRGNAYFPASVTFVFGKDSLSLGIRERIRNFFRELWDGFQPSGIRLTYAWGNHVPIGSMYRLWDEETVFIVAGPEEVGKKVGISRDLLADFRAAYERAPKGPVTEVRAQAERPKAEKGTAHTAITVRLPGK
jgi:hypothetical protein